MRLKFSNKYYILKNQLITFFSMKKKILLIISAMIFFAGIFCIFCINSKFNVSDVQVAGNGCEQQSSNSLKQNNHLHIALITYCKEFDATHATIQLKFSTKAFSQIEMYSAGYINGEKITLSVNDLNGHVIQIPVTQKGEEWSRLKWELPNTWKSDVIQLELIDSSGEFQGWGGIAIKEKPALAVWMKLLIYSVFHAVLIIFPMIFIGLLLLHNEIKNPLILITVGACFGGLLSYSIFWVSLLSFFAGRIIFFSAFLLMFALSITILKKTWRSDAIRILMQPTLIWLSYSVFILSAGLAPTGDTDPLHAVATRFSHALPMDNQLPLIFAKQIETKSISIPMIGDWLTSDRPPLQTAYFLTAGWFGDDVDVDFHYQITSTLLQCLWVIAMWSLLKTNNIRGYGLSLALLVPMFSSVALVHGLFTWPKLFPAFYIFLICAFLLNPNKNLKTHWHYGILIGCLSGLAMLCHGGSIFPLLGIALAMLIFKRLPSISFTISAIAMAFTLLLTWSIYQGLIDPPGNRLTKWHLAGVIPIDARTFRDALFDSYKNVSFYNIVDFKLANLNTLIGSPMKWAEALINVVIGNSSVNELINVRTYQFFTVFASLGVFSITPILLTFALFLKPSSKKTLGIRLIVISLCTFFVWSILLFGPNYTVIHQGSLAPLLLILCGSVLYIYSLKKWLAAIFSALHLLIIYKIYFSFGWETQSIFANFQPSLLIISAISLLICTSSLILFPQNSQKKHH
jgi:hypothetical protein